MPNERHRRRQPALDRGERASETAGPRRCAGARHCGNANGHLIAISRWQSGLNQKPIDCNQIAVPVGHFIATYCTKLQLAARPIAIRNGHWKKNGLQFNLCDCHPAVRGPPAPKRRQRTGARSRHCPAPSSARRPRCLWCVDESARTQEKKRKKTAKITASEERKKWRFSVVAGGAFVLEPRDRDFWRVRMTPRSIAFAGARRCDVNA